MKLGIPRVVRQSLAVAALALLLLAACESAAPTPVPPEELRFSVHLGEELFYHVRGKKSEFEPGESSTLRINLRNLTQNPVDVEFCALLVEQNGPIRRIGQDVFTAQPDAESDEELALTMPDGVEDGRYALALSIPGRNSVVNNIWFGEAGQEDDELLWTGPLRLHDAPQCQ
ncbi:MAG: hypothetical protein ACOC5K_03780 [Chloroflexota bacterium]